MSRTLLKVAGEQNDPLRVKIFPHDFVDKPLLPLYPTSEMYCLSEN